MSPQGSLEVCSVEEVSRVCSVEEVSRVCSVEEVSRIFLVEEVPRVRQRYQSRAVRQLKIELSNRKSVLVIMSKRLVIMFRTSFDWNILSLLPLSQISYHRYIGQSFNVRLELLLEVLDVVELLVVQLQSLLSLQIDIQG